MTAPRIAACPRCGTSTRLDPQNIWRPFCSERCKLIDLGDWMSGRYALPVTEDPENEPGPEQDRNGDH